MDPEKMGKLIAELRKAKRLTQKELAAYAINRKIKRSDIAKYPTVLLYGKKIAGQR